MRSRPPLRDGARSDFGQLNAGKKSVCRACGAEPHRRGGLGSGARSTGMDGHSGLMLFGAGLVGGIVTAIVGGASLITFPALLAAGLPPIIANASNTVALTPGNLVAGLADRERLPEWDRSLLGLMLVCVAGSAAGALLLLPRRPARPCPPAGPGVMGRDHRGHDPDGSVCLALLVALRLSCR